MINLDVCHQKIVVTFQKIINVLDDFRHCKLYLRNLALDAKEQFFQEIMFVDQSFDDFFLGVIEICSRRICRDDVVYDFDTLSVIFAFLYPANAGGNIFESLSLELFLREYLFDHLENE